MDDNAHELGLKNIANEIGNNPYNAPPGSIVVVKACSPGTSCKSDMAGDITVAGKDGYFWNGGANGYGGSAAAWDAANPHVLLGCYVPIKCSGEN